MVVAAGETDRNEFVAPGIAVPNGGFPVNHWNCRPEPVACTVRFAVPPGAMVVLCGCWVIDGLTQAAVTVTVTSWLFCTGPHWPDTLTQYVRVLGGVSVT